MPGRTRHRRAQLLSLLPFCILDRFTRAPAKADEDGWTVWLDAHYLRYCRHDAAIWGWRGSHAA
jgi:hypothetical protein